MDFWKGGCWKLEHFSQSEVETRVFGPKNVQNDSKERRKKMTLRFNIGDFRDGQFDDKKWFQPQSQTSMTWAGAFSKLQLTLYVFMLFLNLF